MLTVSEQIKSLLLVPDSINVIYMLNFIWNTMAGSEDEDWILAVFQYQKWLVATLSVLIIIKVTNTCSISNYYSCNSFSTSFLYSSIPPSLACTDLLLAITHSSLHTTLIGLIRCSLGDTRMTPPYNNNKIT